LYDAFPLNVSGNGEGLGSANFLSGKELKKGGENEEFKSEEG
jgi:hypothetical protein